MVFFSFVITWQLYIVFKQFWTIERLHPIIGTTNTPHSGIEKYFSSLLNHVTENEVSVKDSFEAAKRIQDLPYELFDQGYNYINLTSHCYLPMFL